MNAAWKIEILPPSCALLVHIRFRPAFDPSALLSTWPIAMETSSDWERYTKRIQKCGWERKWRSRVNDWYRANLQCDDRRPINRHSSCCCCICILLDYMPILWSASSPASFATWANCKWICCAMQFKSSCTNAKKINVRYFLIFYAFGGSQSWAFLVG